MMIPKIIHQIAPKNKKRWHPIWEKCHLSWKKQFPEPEYKHILWNDDKNIDSIVSKNYPQYFNFYKNLPYHIMKIDFARLCILHSYGGIYADMDMFCYKNFYDELDSNVNIIESISSDERVQNSLMASVPNHRFLQMCIDLCKITDQDIIYSPCKEVLIKKVLGPYHLSNVLNLYELKEEIKILPSEHFNGKYYFFDSKCRTRHMLTGLWGTDDINVHFEKNKGNSNLQKILKNKYLSDKGINLDTFDFYKN